MGLGSTKAVVEPCLAANRWDYPWRQRAERATICRVAGFCEVGCRWEKHDRFDPSVGRGNMGIAAQILIRQYELVHRIAVGAAKPIVEIVAIASVLRRTRLRIQKSFVGANTEIAPVGIGHAAGPEQFDLSVDRV